jgi:uncharacterized protein (TIGR03086 family)
VAADFTERAAAVPLGDRRWNQQSPCPDWKAIDVVKHIIDVHHMFFGLIEHEAPAPLPVEADPVAAWAATRDAMIAALDDPTVAGREYEGFFGRSRWDASVDRFISGDLVIHAWDLARALGIDDTLDPAEVRQVHETAKGFGDAMRSPGAFGPPVEPPPDATEQEALLAYVGRDPRA